MNTKEQNRAAQQRYRDRRRGGEAKISFHRDDDKPADIAWNPRIAEHGPDYEAPKAVEA